MTPLAAGDITLFGYASSRYRTASARTSAPSTLVLALHDAALASLQQALDGGSSAALMRAHALIAELQLGLDKSAAEELCSELSSVYDFMLQSITHAFVQAAPAELSVVQSTLRELRATWAELSQAA